MNPFLPKENRASTVRKKALVFYITILLVFYVSLNFVKTAAPGILGFASNIFVEEIVETTNAYRQENGLSVLRFDSALSQAAKEKAEDMFADDYWAHVAPDGTKPWFFITEAGYDYVYAGENLAKDFQKSDAVVVAWMESPSHRQNILNEKFKDIGIAVVNGNLAGYETTLVVQMFGRRPPEALAKGGQGSPTQVAPTDVGAATTQITPEVLSQPEVGEAGQRPAATSEAERAGQRPVATQLPPLVEESAVVEIPEAPSKPTVDVFNLTRGMSMALGSMVLGFFTVDTYEARRRGLTRLSGHTVAHFGLLILLLGVTWFMKPGVVL